MEANLIKVGNSKGIIIPSKLLKLIGLKERVKIEVHDESIIISPVKEKVREGWEEMIKDEIGREGQPKRLMPDFFDDEENIDLEW